MDPFAKVITNCLIFLGLAWMAFLIAQAIM